jgi:hypothetical protein
MSAPEARGPEDKDDATGAGLRRCRAVLRLLLFLVMLLAPDFSDSDVPSASSEALQPAFASASM